MPEMVQTFLTQCENAGALEAFSAQILGFSKKKKERKKIGHWSERSANMLVFYWLPAVNKGLVLQTAAAYGF